MQKITPFLWFDTQAEEAAKFYASVFPADAKRAKRVLEAMLEMKKIDIAGLKQAYEAAIK
jgi:predicted 3-demethylubiquinone-9 3-methyltransferase (glyoxalase superfamily)